MPTSQQDDQGPTPQQLSKFEQLIDELRTLAEEREALGEGIKQQAPPGQYGPDELLRRLQDETERSEKLRVEEKARGKTLMDVFNEQDQQDQKCTCCPPGACKPANEEYRPTDKEAAQCRGCALQELQSSAQKHSDLIDQFLIWLQEQNIKLHADAYIAGYVAALRVSRGFSRADTVCCAKNYKGGWKDAFSETVNALDGLLSDLESNVDFDPIVGLRSVIRELVNYSTLVQEAKIDASL